MSQKYRCIHCGRRARRVLYNFPIERLTLPDSSKGFRIETFRPAEVAASSSAAAALLCPSPVSEERMSNFAIDTTLTYSTKILRDGASDFLTNQIRVES